MSNVRFIRYDQDIWELQDLTVLSKLILNHIRSFEDKGLDCFTSPDLLSELYGVPRLMVDISIQELEANEYIKTMTNGSVTVMTIIWKKDISVDDYFGSDIFDV